MLGAAPALFQVHQSSTQHQCSNTAQAPVVEHISRALAVSHVAADAALHAARAPVVEYISQEFRRSKHVGATQPGHRAGNVCLHVFLKAGNASN